jgi:hypothetical protein
VGSFVGVFYFEIAHVLSICLRAGQTGEVQGSRQIDMQDVVQYCACCLLVVPKLNVGE